MSYPFSTLDDLQMLCETSAAEGLQLEFKLKEVPQTPVLSKVDKRSIAETVSSFANSDGGTLVYGVRSEHRGGLDVAVELVPIEKVSQFAAEFRNVSALNISPELLGVSIQIVSGIGESGYLICDVPRSDRRPHMSTAPGVHRYYRRSFEGSALMTPSEITDQILAVREAVLDPTVRIATGAALSNMGHWIALSTGAHFGIENVGTRTCKNPFLRVRCDQPTSSHGATFDQRLGAWKNNLAPGTLVHVDDALSFFELKLLARVLVGRLYLEHDASAEDLVAAVRIYPGTDDLHSRTITDKVEIDSVTFEVTYGAENSAARVQTFTYTRDQIASLLLVNLEDALRNIAQQTVGVWRTDLVDSLRQNMAAA